MEEEATEVEEEATEVEAEAVAEEEAGAEVAALAAAHGSVSLRIE